MTLQEIKSLLVQAAPDIRHYFSVETDIDYTWWEETEPLPYTADGVHVQGWVFYVHRFTRQENDSVAAALFALLDADPRIAVSSTQDYEPETDYTHYIFRCEAL